MSVGHWCADSAKRLFRELRVLNEGLANDPAEVELYACDDVDLSRWIGIIPGACARVNARNQERVTKLSLCVSFKTGPKHTPYEGGRFKVDIQIPAHYPLCPPRVTFLTKIWHPNVSSKNGKMCLFRRDWSPALFVISVVRALQCLLDDPEPDDPHDETVTEQYISDFDKFQTTAREWTKRYAGDESLEPLNVPRLLQPPSWGGDAKNLDKVREHLENAMSCVDESSGHFQEGVYVQIASDLKSIYDYISPVN